jgi:ABC-type Na+ efflux pump permease subunit
MSQTILMFRKEWLNFLRGDRSVFLVYLMLVAGWGGLLASMHTSGPQTAPLWVVFFSVIIAANFSSTVFVIERMSGSLEILLTSGMSRSAILYGKMAFVVVMTVAIGAACMACALLLRRLFAGASTASVEPFTVAYCALYVSATVLNAASSAYLSVWLPNPRLLHFINLLLLGFIMTAYLTVSFIRPVSLYAVVALLTLLAAVFAALARKEFQSERIVKPVVL